MMIVGRGCKSAMRPRHCSNVRLFWNAPPPCALASNAHDSDGTAVQSGRHTQARESQGYAVRPRRYTLPRRESPRRGSGDLDAARGAATSQIGFGALGNDDWAPETRQAEQPCRGNGRSNDHVTRKGARCCVRIQWRIGAESNNGIAIAAPAAGIVLCCGWI